MNNNLKTLWMLLVMALIGMSLTACSDDDDAPGNATGFKVSKEAMTYLRTASSQTLYIESRTMPSVTADASWLHVGEVKLNGTSNKTYAVEIAADDNTEYDNRTATITVAAGSDKASVAVTQSNREGIVVTDIAREFPAEGGAVVVKYQSTSDVKAVVPDWVTVAETRAMVPGEIIMTASANRSGLRRLGEIRLELVADPSVVVVEEVSQEPMAVGVMAGAFDIARDIKAGVNIGNTLEASGGETAWGAAKINADYVRAIKNAGFNAVRIPCSWSQYVEDEATYKIQDAWLDRVAEVVGLVVDNDMYAILNIHWDGGWLEDNVFDLSKKDAIAAKQKALWTQIATRLNNFGDRLLFAGSNEVGMNEANSGKKFTSEVIDNIVYFSQVFVDAVRATGGNNAARCLVVQAPATEIDRAVEWPTSLPVDSEPGRLLYEVHFYAPSDFCLMESDGQWGPASKVRYFWGKDFHTGTDRDCTWGEEDYVSAQFAKMKTNFVDKGLPVILGEFGATRRELSGDDKQKHLDSRAYYHSYVVREAKNNGMVPFFWETPGSIFNRVNGSIVDQQNVDAMMAGAAEGKYPF